MHRNDCWCVSFLYFHRTLIDLLCSVLFRQNTKTPLRSVDKYSFLLGFIMSKNSKCFWFYILIKSSVRNFSQFYFWLHKSQKERVSTESINYLIRLVFRTNSGNLHIFHLKVVCSSSVMICSVLLTYSGCRNELELHFKVTRYVV